MKYYISDLHLQDQRVFDKCSRPFKDLNELTQTICDNWKKVVKKEDEVYLLGDLAEDSTPNAVDCLKDLPGTKYLIIGNHDLKNIAAFRKSKIFKWIKHDCLIRDEGRVIHLTHYPLMDWMEFTRNGYHIYGHIHNKTAKNGQAYVQIKEYYKDKPAYNASCDVIGYTPRTLDELIKLKEANRNEPYIN